MESTRYFLTIDISIIRIWVQASELTSPGWLAQCTGSNCWNSVLSPEADHFKKSQLLTHDQGDKKSIGMDEGDPTSATCFAILSIFLLMFYLLVCARGSLPHSLDLSPTFNRHVFSQLKVSVLYMFKNKSKSIKFLNVFLFVKYEDIMWWHGGRGWKKMHHYVHSLFLFFP